MNRPRWFESEMDSLIEASSDRGLPINGWFSFAKNEQDHDGSPLPICTVSEGLKFVREILDRVFQKFPSGHKPIPNHLKIVCIDCNWRIVTFAHVTLEAVYVEQAKFECSMDVVLFDEPKLCNSQEFEKFRIDLVDMLKD